IVTPAPATTTKVSSDFTVSRPGSARCSQAIRAAPMTTETTAAAPMYHHSPDCRNSTAPPALRGPAGRTPDTSAPAAATNTTAARIRPTRPTAAIPSPARIRVATRAPRANSDRMATARLIHVTYPVTVVRMVPEAGATEPGSSREDPPVPVRFGVPMYTHTVP